MGTVTAPGGARVRAGLLLGCACLALGPLAGCGATPGPTAAPAPTTTSPQELCSRIVTHWAHRVLDDGPHGHLDYQEMGLSGGQYEILRAAVAAARALPPGTSPAAAHAKAAAEVARGCEARYRAGTPTGGPWQ
ncbi:hypothetical protein [Streptomyces sp. NPDC089919]|uniref:hypothetical protein n=1 Tax=Streptomyces sp. NPDC089919 TaxID=3155188 RepID=UPI0034430686